jgi:Tol biopolymer transport system component
MARKCPACGRANDEDASSCRGCGAALAAVSATTDGGPPRRGKPAPRWPVALIAVAAIAFACVLVFVFYPRGGGTGEPASSPAAGVTVSPAPFLKEYLAGAVGPKADRLAAILDDGTVRPITRFSGERIRQIAYSPDGEWLACIAGTFKRSELWLFSTATGDARQVTADTPGIVAVDSIAWLSDGQLLVAGCAETPRATGQNAELLIYGVAGKSFAPLADSGGVSLRGVSVSASRDGVRVAFVTYSGHKTDKYGTVTARERLELLDRASGAVTELGANKAFFDVNARAFDEPLLSPNGEAVIYRRAGSDVGTSYTIVAADGRTIMPARETQFPAGYAWDPGGMKVVFTGHPLKPAAAKSSVGPAIFWVYDTEAGSSRVLARYANAMVQDLSWSPDGASIAWAGYDRTKHQASNVYLLPADGGDSTVLVEGALSPVWAPRAAESLQTSPSP